MNKSAAFNFLSNISLGNNSKPNSTPVPSSSTAPTSSSSSSSSSNNSDSSQLTISKYISKPISKQSNEPNTVHSWIFNMPWPSYKSIEPKVGSKITLNIKQKQIILKMGDKFYFSVSTPMKVDKIVSSSVVIGDPVQSKDNTATTNIVLQFEKIFSEPIPRSIFSEYPLLNDLITSKNSFTRVSDSQLPQFLEVITSFSTKIVKKEAINFLSGISLGDKTTQKTDNQNSPSLPTNTPRNISQQQQPPQQQPLDHPTNVNTQIPLLSLNTLPPTQQPIQQQQTVIDKQYPQPQQPIQQQPQQPQHVNTDKPHLIHHIQHQIPPPNQNPLLNIDSLQNPTTVTTTTTTATNIQTIPPLNIAGTNTHSDNVYALTSKRNNSTIEEYNNTYNLSLNQRIFFVTPGSGHPISVFSMIKGESRKIISKKSMSKREKDSLLTISGPHMEGHHHHHHAGDNISHLKTQISSLIKETSYANLLGSNFVNSSLIGDEVDINGVPLKYNPKFLDNAELKTGKHRTVMNLPSYKVSIFPFIKKGAIKEELNEQFRQKHTWINPQTGITLYKIRKIKRKLKKIALLADLDISTLALAFVLLEKMIIRNQIFKPHFKLYSVCCLLLAAKFNDSKALESLASLFDAIEKKFSITKKELIQTEFQVFSLVSFGLFTDYHDVIPHLNRLKAELVDSDQIMPLVK
ncbi:argonaut-like protein [Tieghemostelium lacteum]|uniref:Argonaut-like protein n=1 Tax=Tieghemostelium lacteum TaxID=361077 RepID=A0A151Z610_TIELA|nr:argonaut-like protein [Tieghemostelium lacteum]|eukprot:KYQ89393.1 argonaut-like protein [Tieghemostelium lacteum]